MEIATFFNSKGGDRKYNAAHWANYFKPLFKSGVFNGDLQVVENGGMSVTVNSGYAWLIGYGYQNTEPLVIDLEVASGNLNRYDAIKIKLDLSARTITAYADKGGNAASPAKPANTRSDTVFEITLAEVYIAAGTTVITQSMITDTRMDNSKCGWVAGAVDQIDFSQIYAQFNKYFDEQRFRIVNDVETFEEGIDQKQQAADEYLQQYKGEVDNDKTAADEFLENFKQYLQNYTSQQQAEFEAWIDTIKGILDEEVAGQLLIYIQDLQERVDIMEAVAATNEVVQSIVTSDGSLLVTDDGERIGARKVFATL
ncbi:MAG: hypothetical protein J6C58_06585 [Bacteroidaceae bacterium]|nr:hypothetical protein [Bacteroidaceae bacterium]